MAGRVPIACGAVADTEASDGVSPGHGHDRRAAAAVPGSHRGRGAGRNPRAPRPAGLLPVAAVDVVGHGVLVGRPASVVAPGAHRPRRLPVRQHPAHRPGPADAPVARMEPGAAPRRRPAGVEPLQRGRRAPPGQLRVGCAVPVQRAVLLPAVAGRADRLGRPQTARPGAVHLPLPAQGGHLAPGRHGGGGRVHVRRLQRAVAGLAPSRRRHLPARRPVLRRGRDAGRHPGAPATGLVRLRRGRTRRLPGRPPGDPVLRLGRRAPLRPVAPARVPGARRGTGTAGQGRTVRGGERAGRGAGRGAAPALRRVPAAQHRLRGGQQPGPVALRHRVLRPPGLPRPLRGAERGLPRPGAAGRCPQAAGRHVRWSPTTTSRWASTSACWPCCWPEWGRCRPSAGGRSSASSWPWPVWGGSCTSTTWVASATPSGGCPSSS